MKPKVTKKEFEIEHAQVRGITVKELRKRWCIVRCVCGWKHCDGWRFIEKEEKK